MGNFLPRPSLQRSALAPDLPSLDEAGLKGLQIGGATVSEKHANFIVNDRKGSAADVRRLAEHVRAVVRDRSGIDLQPEIEFVGDWDAPVGEA